MANRESDGKKQLSIHEVFKSVLENGLEENNSVMSKCGRLHVRNKNGKGKRKRERERERERERVREKERRKEAQKIRPQTRIRGSQDSPFVAVKRSVNKQTTSNIRRSKIGIKKEERERE
jgi:hypothetical protein